MTVVVYDGKKTIAADRLEVVGTTKINYVKKIREHNGVIYAGAGASWALDRFPEWLDTGATYACKRGDLEILYVKDGQVYYVDFRWLPTKITHPWGIGSGGDAAEHLVRAGFTALEAAKYAVKYDTNCGGPVDVVNIR